MLVLSVTMRTCVQCGATYEDGARFCQYDGTSLEDVRETTLIGRTIDGKYRVLSRLGEGGYGQIYRARHLQLPRDAALKVMSPRHRDDPAQVTRFLFEVRSIARLDHPDIVTIYDVGEDERTGPYMAMRLLHGEDLGARLQRDGPLPIQQIRAVMSAMCRALSAAHEHGIVHRDVKPNNVFLERSESELVGFRAVLLDFGVATIGTHAADLTSEALTPPRVTGIGMVVGSPETMSPEVATGGDAGPESDIFSAGVCLYVMLTGQLPYPGRSAREQMLARLRDPPARPSSQQGAEWIPMALDHLVLDMLRVRREQRPTSMHAVLERLESVRAEAERAWAEHHLVDEDDDTATWQWATDDSAGAGARPDLGQTVLLADDEPAILELGRLVLQNAGYDVRIALGGAQALERLDDTLAALVLDVMMPDIDGVECARLARERGFTGPILLFTTIASARVREQVEAMSNVSFVDKTRELHLLPTFVRRAAGSVAGS